MSEGMQAQTTEETITKTVKLPLQTSQRKNDRVQSVIDEWQLICKTLADYHPSFPKYEWGRTKQNPSFYRIIKREHENVNLHSAAKVAATHKVGAAFASWHSNGHDKHQPQFGGGDYCRFTNEGVALKENDGGGYGIKVNLEPYNPEWWRISTEAYHRDYLDAITNGESKHGAVELHLSDGDLTAHLAVSTDVLVYKTKDTPRTLGVDLGERIMYAAAVSDGGSVEAVKVRQGGEFRDTRERLKRKRAKLMKDDDLRGVRACRDEHYRYTDHMTHVASREIVDLAVEHRPVTIVLEDLTGYRDTATDAIHDWPFAELQTKIAYKATEEGIPVRMVDPAGTSYTCSDCGESNPAWRDGPDFYCGDCGYEVHADVNAAMNLANM